MTGLPASLRVARPPRKPAGTTPRGFGVTRRLDAWWMEPAVQGTLFTVCAVYLFISGVLLTPLFDTPYEVDGYLSPLFSPLITPSWLPSWISPGLLILWIPLGFRATCYYYRKAYYRFYFADPPGCAVGEPEEHRVGLALADQRGESVDGSRLVACGGELRGQLEQRAVRVSTEQPPGTSATSRGTTWRADASRGARRRGTAGAPAHG